jgi:hypothetical protein
VAAALPKFCKKRIFGSGLICLFIFLGFVLDHPTANEAEARPISQPPPIKAQMKDISGQPAKLPRPRQDLVPTLSNASLSPSAGTTRTTFVFEITYTSPTGLVPAYVVVRVSNDAFSLRRTSTSSSLEAGVRYQARIRLPEGEHLHHFEAFDGQNIIRDPPSPDRYAGPSVGPPENPPTLSEQSVTPVSGYQMDIFTFSVKYNDSNNNAPTYVRVVIDNSSYAMETLQSDANYSEGVRFSYQTQLGPGTHAYHFEAASSFGSTRLPVNDEELAGPDVSPLVLTTYLANASVDPLLGDKKTVFGFSVVYVSQENATPTFVRLRLGESIYYMRQRDPNDQNYTTGVVFQYQRTLSFGIHDYAFEGTNGSYVIRYPPTGAFPGPTVVPSGEPPSLENPSVTPAEGVICRDFVFRVNYINNDNNAPVYVSVVINSSTTSNFAMDPTNSSDYNYANGAEFLTSIQICQEGKFYFYFEASDGYHIVRTPTANATLLEFQVTSSSSREVDTDEYSPSSEAQNAIGFTGLSLAFAFTLALILRYKFRNNGKEK